MPKKSILQQAIDNSKIPLSTIAMSASFSLGSLFYPSHGERGGRKKRVVPDSAVSYKDPYQTDGSGVVSCPLITSVATVTHDTYSQPVQLQQVQRPKTPAPKLKETVVVLSKNRQTDLYTARRRNRLRQK